MTVRFEFETFRSWSTIASHLLPCRSSASARKDGSVHRTLPKPRHSQSMLSTASLPHCNCEPLVPPLTLFQMSIRRFEVLAQVSAEVYARSSDHRHVAHVVWFIWVAGVSLVFAYALQVESINIFDCVHKENNLPCKQWVFVVKDWCAFFIKSRFSDHDTVFLSSNLHTHQELRPSHEFNKFATEAFKHDTV